MIYIPLVKNSRSSTILCYISNPTVCRKANGTTAIDFYGELIYLGTDGLPLHACHLLFFTLKRQAAALNTLSLP